MEKWNEDGKFIVFKTTNVIKQISHTDNQVIWFTDNSFLYPINFFMVEPVTLAQITEILNKHKIRLYENLLNTTNQKIQYKCWYCHRCFIKKIPHKCFGGYRKRGLKWEQSIVPIKQAKS